MAEGGRDFGYEDPELDNLLDNDDDDDDDEQEVHRTQPFQPGASSTPYHRGEQVEMQTMLHEQSGLPETPLLDDFISSDEKKSFLQKKLQDIKKKHPRVDFGKINPINYSKKGDKSEIVSFGPRGGETKIFKKGTSDLLKSFIDKNLSALGPPAEDIIAEDRDTIGEEIQRLKETEKQLKQTDELVAKKEQLAQNFQEIRSKKERAQGRLDEINDKHGSNIVIETEIRRLKRLIENFKTDEKNIKKEFDSVSKKLKNKEKLEVKANRQREKIAEKKRETNAMQERLNETKTLDELKERESELQRKNEEDLRIKQDENASPSDKEAAEGRTAERNEELALLQTEIAERERARPLLERVKEIFKKYGVTVASVLLAAGVTIGVVVSTVTNALKASTKALGKGLKDIGAKLGSLLPGLIGSIANFLFKAAGQAIGFLAEHTWLLILAVVAFLFEKYQKKRR